jgi:hypothetical protein
MVGGGTDAAGKLAWLETYCHIHPTAGFVVALIHLREYLIER